MVVAVAVNNNDNDGELLCEEHGYCDPIHCPLILECWEPDGEAFICPICNKIFDNIYYLKYHYIHAHRSNMCPICGKYFKNISDHAVGKWLKGKNNEYAVLYWLTTRRSGRSRNTRELLNIACDIARIILSMNILKWK